jgi:hypothetical protein
MNDPEVAVPPSRHLFAATDAVTATAAVTALVESNSRASSHAFPDEPNVPGLNV